jgi:hypothetical protein
MTVVEVPAPVLKRPATAGTVDVGMLAANLREAVVGEVRFDPGSRALGTTRPGPGGG